MEPRRTTAIVMFDDRSHAERGVAELLRQNFRQEQIGVLWPDEGQGIEMPRLDPGTKAREGTAVGVAAGAGLGALVGVALTTAAIPGVGPILAGGLLAGLVGGAAAGAASGGVVGVLVGLKIPEEEAKHFERQLHSGRTLVSVQTEDRYEEALAILERIAAEGETSGRLQTRHHRVGSADASDAPGGGGIAPGM